MAFLAVENLTFTYPGKKEPAIKGVSFEAEKGEFICICGATGSGKSTLLRLLKRELAPIGEKSGNISLSGANQEALSDEDSAYKIGFVMQRPEQQLVTDKVWHELAFGLENMNLPRAAIARRVSEMAAYFGIEEWYEKDVNDLSGGQKQLLNLAAVMVMQPDILILDEPTSQLDPIAASEFIQTVKKLNRDFALTVLITEHRLEEVVPVSDKMIVLEKGSVLYSDAPEVTISKLTADSPLLLAMPAAARLYHALSEKGSCPIEIKDGRRMIEQKYRTSIRALPEPQPSSETAPALSFRNVYFRYDRHGRDILNGVSFTVQTGEIYAILGGNGSGKTTSLSVASALLKPYAGEVRVFDKKIGDYKNQSLYRECLTRLPQDVQTVFLANTVKEELRGAEYGMSLLPIDFTRFFDMHPYDLSGGEQQLLALAKVLSTKPKLLLLDEPTKGVDALTKQKLTAVLKSLKDSGMTVVLVTHDVEFAAETADKCAMFFRGDLVSAGTPREFFSKNSFYTTPVSRMTRGIFENAVTLSGARDLCLKNGRKGEEA
ncbi:MAG: energy-coupling factor ABC transporter ATP-binding protein [Clostridia bacterium]|nr:energy-coupling factor ABC transporter ATP-binding protein [Clostridia bacterium]